MPTKKYAIRRKGVHIDRSKTLVYVGKWRNIPSDVEELPLELRKVHPVDFDRFDYPPVFWTNNPLLVDLFSAENVMVCGSKGIRPLSRHAKWKQWKKKLSTGKFWMMFGEEWPWTIPGFGEVGE
jgi:hypothetical protein